MLATHARGSGLKLFRQFRTAMKIEKTQSRAKMAQKQARSSLKAVLGRWQTAYDQENFYRGIRILLELQRNGSSTL
jgi:hypothetical protein